MIKSAATATGFTRLSPRLKVRTTKASRATAPSSSSVAWADGMPSLHKRACPVWTNSTALSICAAARAAASIQPPVPRATATAQAVSRNGRPRPMPTLSGGRRGRARRSWLPPARSPAPCAGLHTNPLPAIAGRIRPTDALTPARSRARRVADSIVSRT